MRFDDSLATVLAADMASGFGAQSAWRQLVDLAGRRRVPDLDAAVARLRALRPDVSAAVRAASGRALAWANPPLALVALFAEDELAIAAPVLRTARLDADQWTALLPRLTPAGRSVLRHRRDLPDAVMRALESFGATDFVLGDGRPVVDRTPPPEPEPQVEPPPPIEPASTPFVAIGEIARALPAVEDARRQLDEPPQFAIADLVARIDAFRQERPLLPSRPPQPAPEQWQFEADAAGVIRWVEGVARGPLIGLDLARSVADARTALRTRSTFRDAELQVGGDSSAAGSWRLSGVPRFDRATGRFEGLSGMAKRPRRALGTAQGTTASDTLRQLVHELRTPANAIAGFSELISTALLGPVPPLYRERAMLIGDEAARLAAAIDDLDLIARMQGDALDLRPAPVDVAAMVTRAAAVLQAPAAERRVTLSVEGDGQALAHADDQAAAKLVERLLATALAAAEPGERLRTQVAVKPRTVRLHVTRPRALTIGAEDDALAIDAGAGGALLGVGFTLRMLRDLAAALDGSLAVTPDRLTLRLPAAVTAGMERTAMH